MSDEVKMNGAEQGSAAPVQAMDARAYLENWVGIALQCTLRGAIGCLPGYPAAAIVVMACRCLGALVGSVFGGPLTEVLARRRDCREAFLEGLNKAPIPQFPSSSGDEGARPV